MKVCLSLVAFLSLPALGSGQTFTSPPGYLSKEGGSMARGWEYAAGVGLFPGALSTARYQFADGEGRGGLKIIKSVGYRLDYFNHRVNYGAPGRSWSLVTLTVSETDITKFQSVFSNNPTTAQTEVFRRGVTWPTQLGTPGPAAPAPWDTRLAFPFNTPWRYSGKQDILLDYTFLGGVLANNTNWNINGNPYFLDGLFYAVGVVVAGQQFPQASTCMDPAAKRAPPLAVSADAHVQYNQYSKAYRTIPQWTDTVVIQAWTDRTAPSAPVIQALGIAALNNGVGVPFPGSCHNLIIDPSKIGVLVPNRTNGNGLAPTTWLVAGRRKAVNALGLRVWTQAAWIHSQTGAFTLTRAMRTENPTHLEVNDTVPKRLMTLNSDTKSMIGRLPDLETAIIRYN